MNDKIVVTFTISGLQATLEAPKTAKGLSELTCLLVEWLDLNAVDVATGIRDALDVDFGED